MPRAIAAFITIGLIVYALIDIWQTPRKDVRFMPVWAWVLLVLLVPIVGPVWWLIAGRNKPQGGFGRRAEPTRAPDDDPDFLDRLAWEQRKRRRQEEDQKPDDDPPTQK